MAIKGNGYTKTTWAFQERPVASSKLNQWDDRIEAALELTYFLLNLAWGGGNGVLRGATADDLKVVPTNPASLSVQAQPGYAFVSKFPFRLAVAASSVEVVAPSSHPRIDIVQAKLATWGITVKTGTEAATPSAPSPDGDCIVLAQLYLRPGMTCIKETDDGVNGFIVDVRTFV